MKTPGKNSSYTPEIAAEICDRLAAGESLRAICKDHHMPAESSVRHWAITDVNGFAAQYAHARDIGLDAIADELIEISDDGSNDWMDSNDPENPGYRFNGEAAARSRLRLDARKWYLSKLAPKRYGEKTSMELTGADGGPVQLSDTERAAKMAALLAAAKARRDQDSIDDLV